MSDITHEDLDRLGDRLERLLDRQRDEFKDDIKGVHARVSEIARAKEAQNGRVLKAEENIGALSGDVRTLRHDLTNHLNAHVQFSAVVEKLKAPTASGAVQLLARKPSKGFVAGIVATITALAGVSEGVHQAFSAVMRWFTRQP